MFARNTACELNSFGVPIKIRSPFRWLRFFLVSQKGTPILRLTHLSCQMKLATSVLEGRVRWCRGGCRRHELRGGGQERLSRTARCRERERERERESKSLVFRFCLFVFSRTQLEACLGINLRALGFSQTPDGFNQLSMRHAGCMSSISGSVSCQVPWTRSSWRTPMSTAARNARVAPVQQGRGGGGQGEGGAKQLEGAPSTTHKDNGKARACMDTTANMSDASRDASFPRRAIA